MLNKHFLHDSLFGVKPFQGKGRIEKIEIIEMAIKHIKDLTSIIAHKQDGK